MNGKENERRQKTYDIVFRKTAGTRRGSKTRQLGHKACDLPLHCPTNFALADHNAK